MEKESGTRMASTKEEEEVSSKAEVEEEEKEKEEAFQAAKEKVKEEEIPFCWSLPLLWKAWSLRISVQEERKRSWRC